MSLGVREDAEAAVRAGIRYILFAVRSEIYRFSATADKSHDIPCHPDAIRIDCGLFQWVNNLCRPGDSCCVDPASDGFPAVGQETGHAGRQFQAVNPVQQIILLSG